MKKYRLAVLLLLPILLMACQSKDFSKDDFRIGFSQCIGSDPWRQAMLLEMQQEVVFQKKIRLEIKDAQGSSRRQAAQIDSFIQSGVDALIVSPHDSSRVLLAAVERTLMAGIPLLLLDRKVNTSSYTAFVGADNYEIGKAAGRFAKELLGGHGTIIEIWGGQEASPSIERHHGFHDELKSTSLKILQINGWADTNQVAQKLTQIKGQLSGADLVFGHTDVLTVSAYETFQEWGMEDGVIFVGIDGLLSGGMKWVEERKMDATFLYPTGGTEAIQVVSDILQQRPYQKDVKLPTILITAQNLSVMKAQAERIQHQQRNISLQQENLRIKDLANQRQRTFLWILGIGSAIILGLSIFLWAANKEKQRIKNELQQRNQEITVQKNRLEEISRENEEINEAKVRFFSHISHEIRTPLTLIISPLEEVIRSPTLTGQHKKDLALAQGSVARLLRLMNELLDFCKLEKKQLDISVSEVEVKGFIAELMSPFQPLAKSKGIQMETIFPQEDLNVWLDPSLFDKVVSNLVSNAFKNTPENGKVWCAVKNGTTKDTLSIEIGDTGTGVDPAELPHIFNPFFQGSKKHGTGVGLGLSLTKELVALQQGEISVESKPGRGTLFRILLKKGNAHFRPTQIAATSNKRILPVDLGSLFPNAFLENPDSANDGQKDANKDHRPLLLLIEDHQDLADYLFQHLKDSYHITVENNGLDGLKTALETVPGIILCDVAMPLMNGLKLTQKIKRGFHFTKMNSEYTVPSVCILQNCKKMFNYCNKRLFGTIFTRLCY